MAARVAILSVLGVAFPTFLHAVKSSVHSETSQCHVLVVLSNLDLLQLLCHHTGTRMLSSACDGMPARRVGGKNCQLWLAKVDIISEHRDSFFFEKFRLTFVSTILQVVEGRTEGSKMHPSKRWGTKLVQLVLPSEELGTHIGLLLELLVGLTGGRSGN